MKHALQSMTTPIESLLRYLIQKVHAQIKFESLNQQWIFDVLRHHRDLVQGQICHIFEDKNATAAGGGMGLDNPKAALFVVHL